MPADSIRKQNRCHGAIGQYSLWFALFFLICVLIFYIPAGKSFFTVSDGRHQHFIYFQYVGVWIRELFSNLFVRHVFEVPMWDMSMGMGSDSLTTGLTGLSVVDPFYWISVITPRSIAEYVFDIVVVAKFYFTGLSFILYASYRKLPIKGQVAGALVYTFSAVTYISFFQTCHANPIYFFPLILLGVEKIWNEGRFKTYVAALAFCAMDSYYFTVMMGIYVVCYCILKFFFEEEDRSFKHLISLILRLFLYSLIAVGISLWCVLPSLMITAGSDRLVKDHAIGFFSAEALKTLLFFSFSGRNLYHDWSWGCSSVIVPCYVILFRQRSRRALKITSVVLPVSFLFPFICALFHGLVFATDRHLFGLLFAVSLIVAVTFERLDGIRGKTSVILIIASLLILAAGSITGGLTAMLSGVSLILTVGLITVCNHFFGKKDKMRLNGYYVTILLSSLILSCIRFGGMQGVQDLGKAGEFMFESHGIGLLDEHSVDTDERFDYVPLTYDDIPFNSSCILRTNGTDFYHSTYNGHLSDYYLDMGIVSDAIGYNMSGLRGRPLLELQNGCRYVLHNEKDTCITAPYSYEYIGDDGEYALYEASVDTSLVYYYDDTVSYEDYSSAAPASREEMLMEACLIEGAATTFEYIPYHDMVELKAPLGNGVDVTDTGFVVNEEGGYVSYPIDDISDMEISVYLNGIRSDSPFLIVVSALYDGTNVKGDLFSGIGTVDPYYYGKDDLLFDLGYISEDIDEIRITFYTEGEYALDGIEVSSRSEEQLDSLIYSFDEHKDVQDISYDIDGNHIHIDAISEGDRYIYIAVPYSEGWSATVDGHDAEILCANEAFMALPLGAGEHSIELSYRTPGVTLGSVITGISAAGFVCAVILSRKRCL